MHKYKMARWRRILRRSAFRRRQIRSIRHLRHSRSRAARICSAALLTIAWLLLPLLPGCGAGSAKPPTTTSGSPANTEPAPPLPESMNPPNPAPGTSTGRTITFRGLDNEYRGSTHILPNNRFVHQKDPNE